jgi:hypothetical protein
MITFTERSLPALIDALHEGADYATEDVPLTNDLVSVRIAGGGRTFVHRSDEADEHLTLIAEEAFEYLVSLGTASLVRALERVDRASREFTRPPLSLPPGWHKYQHDGLLAFFALPRSLNEGSLRWIAERLSNGDVCFWELTASGSEKRLADFSTDTSLAVIARQQWGRARDRALSVLPDIEPGERPLQPTVDLDLVGAAAVSRHKAYSAWLPDLTPSQRQVLDYSGGGALKVRGPAGTGKTLVLQLKALQEIYDAQDHERPEPRVLFLTHSWALTELVDKSILAIDERGAAQSNLDVMPLTWLRELLYGELPEGVEVLGEDSLEGKRRQLALISDVVDAVVDSEWSTYETRVSAHLADGATSGSGSDARAVLCWTFMREFAEVIDANQLKPGLNALQRYAGLPRHPWMVDLPRQADREFVFAVYRLFVGRLVEEGQLTTDQALDDFRKYLESYTWNVRRLSDGYDLVLVDEFHLFNDTERYLVHLLTRDPDSPPRMVMAMDPHQSAFTLLTGLHDHALSRRASASLAAVPMVESVDLQTVHRFAEPILRLVRSVHACFPNLVDIGDDWTFDLEASTAARSVGSKPELIVAASRGAAVAASIDAVRQRNSASSPTERVALIAAGTAEFDAVAAGVSDLAHPAAAEFTVIESRDDVDRLNYSRRSIVVGTAEFCAGLQFAHVVVLAFADREQGHGVGASAERASLSEVYLAITRAESTLTVVTSGDEGSVGTALKNALERDVVEQRSTNW